MPRKGLVRGACACEGCGSPASSFSEIRCVLVFASAGCQAQTLKKHHGAARGLNKGSVCNAPWPFRTRRHRWRWAAARADAVSRQFSSWYSCPDVSLIATRIPHRQQSAAHASRASTDYEVPTRSATHACCQGSSDLSSSHGPPECSCL